MNLFSGHQWLPRICLPIKETQVQSLSQEDPLEKETATHSSILARKISWIEELNRLQTIHRVTEELCMT